MTHPSIQMVDDLRTRANIRRKAKGRKSVEEGKPDRLADQLDAAADMIERLKAARALDIEALRGVTDTEPCSFDHNGNCQSHGISNPCETAIARERIAEWDKTTE